MAEGNEQGGGAVVPSQRLAHHDRQLLVLPGGGDR